MRTTIPNQQERYEIAIKFYKAAGYLDPHNGKPTKVLDPDLHYAFHYLKNLLTLPQFNGKFSNLRRTRNTAYVLFSNRESERSLNRIILEQFKEAISPYGIPKIIRKTERKDLPKMNGLEERVDEEHLLSFEQVKQEYFGRRV